MDRQNNRPTQIDKQSNSLNNGQKIDGQADDYEKQTDGTRGSGGFRGGSGSSWAVADLEGVQEVLGQWRI